MLQSILVYSILMSVMIYCGHLAAKRVALNPYQNLSFFHFEILLPIFCFAIIFGMRYGVGQDHLYYLNGYNDAVVGNYISRGEYLFDYITFFFAKTGFHYVFYFTFWAFIQISFLYYSFKKERYLLPFIAFVLFASGDYLGWMNVIRQNVVVCIFIYSINFIQEKKIIPYLICILFCFFIHKSALLLIFLYPILINNRDYFKNITLQIVLLVIAFSLKGFNNWQMLLDKMDIFILFFGYKASYGIGDIEQQLVEVNSGIGVFLLFLIDIFIVLYSKKLKGTFSSTNFLIFYNLYFVGSLLSLILSGSIVLQRPILYFSSMRLIVASYFIYYLWKKFKKNINGLVFLLITTFYLLLFFALIYRGDTNTAQFVFFWQAK